MHKRAPASSVDLRVCDRTKLSLGETTLFVFETPGHTPDSISITCALSEGLCVFTGDTLLIESVGRTDLQGGNSACLACLYESLWRQLLLLPDSTIVYPGHDYKGYLSTTIGRAKRENPKLQLSRSEFISFMDNYHPPKPELYDNAVVVNSR